MNDLLMKERKPLPAWMRKANKDYRNCKSCGAQYHKSQLTNGKCHHCADSETENIVIIKVDRDQFADVVNWWAL
jgi:recombinational DNA repair protein RecR